MIQIQNGNGGNGGSSPIPQPAELNIYSKDGSIDVIDEYDENDEPTGWKNIQRVNNLSAEELEAGAMVLMNFAEEDIVKKQQTYIISTNNGRRIEVTFSGAYTIESLHDLNISVRGDVGDDDVCMIRMYTDPADEHGNRYQGYFFMIWFAGPYQYTQDDDEAFYISADSDRSLINWMWNGLSNAAIQRLEDVDDNLFYLSDYAEGGGDEPVEKTIGLYVEWDTPHPDYLFIKPAIFQDSKLEFVKQNGNSNFFTIKTHDIEGGYHQNDRCYLDDNFKLNATVKDSGLRNIDSWDQELDEIAGGFFRLNHKCAKNFASYLASYVPTKDKFPFAFVHNDNLDIEFLEFFRETAIEEGFIPKLLNLGISDYDHFVVSCNSMFYYCEDMYIAELDLTDYKASYINSLFRTFKGCSDLHEATIKNSNDFIRVGAYPNSIKSLFECFDKCTSLETVTFSRFYVSTPSQVLTTNCFNNCNSLTEVVLIDCDNGFRNLINSIVPAGVTVTVINS